MSPLIPVDHPHSKWGAKRVFMIDCVILTHGDLCLGLRGALEGIMGKQEGFSVISNVGMGKRELASTLHQKVRQKAGGEGVIIFVDMFGTSCWQTAKMVAEELSQEKHKVAVITGVNLPMLVKFFAKRDSFPLNQLVALVKQEGEKGIRTES